MICPRACDLVFVRCTSVVDTPSRTTRGGCTALTFEGPFESGAVLAARVSGFVSGRCGDAVVLLLLLNRCGCAESQLVQRYAAP